ncbi:MAG: (d)CMP kinase [Flavobacteriales bacterium]|tara:strand:- start:1045 stop:1737 length:693 start_codon:yes stop_codon:yes gene_type:complete
MSRKINIAIDGFSSCGKSTIAKAISMKYKMRYIDTGAMYRAITLYCIQNNIIVNGVVNIDMLESNLSNINVEFVYDLKEELSHTILNQINVEDEIRGIEVSENVSIIAKIQMVREKLVFLQQKIGEQKSVVMDGRDIGTKVFPDAEVKFFITADAEVRAGRRLRELQLKNEEVSFTQVLDNIEMRDSNDTSRKINPLKMAEDAILIDNSQISLEEQNILIFSQIDKILKK